MPNDGPLCYLAKNMSVKYGFHMFHIPCIN